MKRTSLLLMLSALLVFAGATDAMSQQFTGNVRGTVSDAQGIIPGVTVTLVNEGTTVARDTITNEVGEYAFPAVAPATYSIRTSLPGYKTYEQRGITVGTQDALTIDLVLEVGTVEEEITVTADAPLIETSNASVGDSLDREILETLPAPGRNAFLIAVTIPTVTPIGDPQFNRQQDQSNASRVSLGGGSIRGNNYLLDGVPITELNNRAVLNPTIEALADVKVQVHTYDAEMGRTGGGVFNTTGRVGTNEFHGSGFFQTRPVWGQTLNYFTSEAGGTAESSGVADSYYRLYGGGGGGPIIQNRTFWWYAMEGYRSFTTRFQQQ
ncbi:MAG TPA: TonB-dependent receptor, partial [Acidobacteria bacterium]|nr:TonB-dependent receptor [Acidobacteriota bacterium]